MPSTPLELFDSVGLHLTGVAPWSKMIPSTAAGVYIVSTSGDSDTNAGTCLTAPIDLKALARWVERVPLMQLDNSKPNIDALAERLSEFWLPDESILYIGKASELKSRIGNYYRTPLGERGPHAGGHWIKSLRILGDLFVHYAETSSHPEASESALLREFVRRVSSSTRISLRDSAHPFPFANLEFPRRVCKAHGLSKPVRPRKLAFKQTIQVDRTDGSRS